MKKFFLAIMAAVMLLVCASVSLAQDPIDINIDNNIGIGDTSANASVGDITNTNNNANNNNNSNRNANSNRNSNRNANSNRNSNLNKSSSNSGGNVYEAAKNYITASTLQHFVAAVTPSTPNGYKQLGCDFIVAEFTIGQLKMMAEGVSFMKKRGTFWYAAISDDVEYSILGGKEASLNDSAVVRIMVKAPSRVRGGAYLGEAEGVGRYGAPMGQIIGATVLGLVQKTGATQVVIYWDYLIEGVAMSNTVGVGVAGSATNGEAGSIAIGGAGSTTYNLTSIAYRIKAQAFSGLGEEYFSCGPEVREPKGCDPSSIWSRIEDLKQRVKECTRWCFNNLQLRSKLGEAYIDLYQCTGDKKYLNYAIEQFQIAERNYFRGYDISAHQAEADRLIAQDYYFWAGCINVLNGQSAADRFAAEKRVEKVPQL